MSARSDSQFESAPIVDVGIPTTGAAPDLLVEAIESVIAQTMSSWQLVIAENGPGLDSVKRALDPYKSDPRIEHVVTGFRMGRGANWTGLIRTGSAPYHGLLHDDDRWAPEFLERRVRFLDEHPSCGFVYGGTVVIDELGRSRGRTRLDLPPGVQRSARIFPALYRRNWIGVPSFLARRSAYEAVGNEYKELLFTDNEMFLRLAAYFDVGCLPVWDGYYRIHSAQTSVDRTRWAEHHLEMLDAVDDLPVSPSLRRMVRAETHLRCALDAVQREERRPAFDHVVQALRIDPVSTCVRPKLAVRTLGALAGIVTGSRGRKVLANVRERRWQTGGAAGLMEMEADRPLPRTHSNAARTLTSPESHTSQESSKLSQQV